jgi:parallel beta-helix repeat protein
MALEKYLVVRPDGQVEKSKSVDKIDTKSLSFFAAIPSVSPSKGFTVLGGYAVILRNFVSLNDTNISMGIGGTHETEPLPIGYWNQAAFSITLNGAIVKTEGTPSATKEGVVSPVFPFGTLPICLVTYQDNGSGAAGSINDLNPVDIVDRRPFFYGSYNQPLDYTDAISDFKVDPTFPPSTDLIVRYGHIYFSNGQLVELPETVLSLGTGGTYEIPATPTNQYRLGIICLTQYSSIEIIWSEPNADDMALARPEIPRGVIPLAAVTVRDNGGSIGGSILPIGNQNIADARPSTSSMLGILRADDLNYVKVQSMFPPDQRVTINGGVVYPSAGLFVDYATTIIDFGSGVNQLLPLSIGYWKRILISLDAAGNTLLFYSPESSSRAGLVNPVIPKNVIPLAFVDVQDDFAGLAGSIRPIKNEHIKDIRPWLGASGSGAGGLTSASSIYSDYLNTSSWEQGFYEDFQDDDLVDTINTTGDVDVLVDNNCTLQPTQKITTLDVYDNFAGLLTIERALVIVDTENSEDLLIEVTNNGGTDWFTVQEKGVIEFSTSGVDLRLRITNVGSSEVVISNFGIFYNDDEISPSFLFSNERLPLFQTIYGSDPEVSGTTVTLKEGRQYPIGENALMVFKNGELLPKDSSLTIVNSYRESSMTTIQLQAALNPSDRLNLVMPAGYFGQTVAQFQSTLSGLVASKHIVDGLVRTPSEGTSPDLQTAINNDLDVSDGGSILLETQTQNITSAITILNKPTYVYSKSRKATLQCLSSYASSLINVQDNSEFQITGITLKSSSYASSAKGINLAGSSVDAVISNCVFQNLGVAINVASGCNRLIIRDCKFLNCGKVVVGSTKVRFINCDVDGSTNGTEGIFVAGDSLVSNNIIKNYSTFGIRLSGSAIVSSNSVSSCDVGIHLNSSADETVVSDNIVKSCTTAIQSDADSCVVKANICKSNSTGIVLNGAENMLESNVVTDNSVDGIVIGASAVGNEIGNNVLARNP